ncbi:gem-associated protein 5 isoform X1 [Patella vulgata]|uniref:gem-associated protein 5 isoform X1 n=2 Tax=Patella vulgata TaxID=6465 RepID=UPI0024A89BB8|nr:gem-associated protein 5 isoform X1 [Patella vulgata]
MSGGFDCSLHRWKISSLPKAVIEYGAKRKKGKKKRTDQDNKKRDHKTSTGSDSNEASGGDRDDNDNNTPTTSQLDDLQKLLDKKREELLHKAEETADNKDTNKKPVAQSNDNKLQQILGSRFYHETKKDTKSNKRTEKTESVPSNIASTQRNKKRKAKSYFPVIAQAENRGKSQTHNDLIQLTKIVCGEKNKRESVSAEHHHLGLFTNRRAAFKCLKKEGEYHQKNDNMDYFLQMEIWKGNIRGALQIAREKDELSDWLVAMAPLGSYDMWLTACEDYARQLEEDGQYHKSATYLLSCHKVYDAIDLFKRHKLYKEAVSLARVRLSPLEPLFEDLYTDWSQQLMKDGQYEQAAKCYVAMKKIQDAAKVLIRRSDQSSLKTAAHMTLLANEKQQGMLYAQRVVNQCLSQYTWQDAYKFLNEHEATKIFVPFVSVHELLVKELQILAGGSIGPISSDKFSVWVDIPPQNSVIPDFILDGTESDPVLPWKPYLTGKHSFPHHVLRCWYCNLNVAMDTNSLSNMYKTLIHHQSGRQGLLDMSQIILQVSGDLTLFLLALLLNETTAAINHLLQAVISLHEAGQLELMQGLCQLVLPHGPKYLLKLQQEVTALHVVISMESHMNIEGASKVNTLKRLLSELKDDDNISSTGHRCRELDCLRAYYYLAVANYLQDQKNKSSDEAKIQDLPSLETDIKVEPDVCAIAEVDSTSEQPTDKEVDVLSQPGDKTQTASSPIDQSKSQDISSVAQTTVARSSKSEPSALTMNKILDMSKGLLWDIQAKRYALTETLGYIHKAISQCLLTDKTKEKSSQPQNVSSHRRPDILLCSKGDKSNDRDVQKDLSGEEISEESKEKEVTDSTDESLHYSDVEMMLANGKDSANKSRKVLWEDQPPLYVCDKHETSTRGTSCLSNPTKYINVPDEWYSMPVDKKYFMSYVTMPVLREEQDFVTHELKRIPDSSHVPFPTTFDTAKMLLKLTQMCEAQDMKEVIEYREKLVKWALNFAVTSKQREELNTLLDTVTKESAV